MNLYTSTPVLILSYTMLDRFNLFSLNNAFLCNDTSQITSKNQIATKRSFNRATTLQKHNRYFVKSMQRTEKKGTAVRLRLCIFSGIVWFDLHCLLCTQFLEHRLPCRRAFIKIFWHGLLYIRFILYQPS